MENKAEIAAVRAASRCIVRELGLRLGSLTGTKLTLSAVQAIAELGQRGRLSPVELGHRLRLGASEVTRLIRELNVNGHVELDEGRRDGGLRLSPKGEATRAEICACEDRQIAKALQNLNRSVRKRVVLGMQAYASALKADAEKSRDYISVEAGYAVGLIGRVVEMHSGYYARVAGFGHFFEVKVAEELSAFIGQLGTDGCEIWTARNAGQIVGSIAVEGRGPNTAHLRWFILDDSCRGMGLGSTLLKRALKHCDSHGFREVRLWTFKGLEAARTLYERNGFRLLIERGGAQWGEVVTEQEYIRP